MIIITNMADNINISWYCCHNKFIENNVFYLFFHVQILYQILPSSEMICNSAYPWPPYQLQFPSQSLSTWK